MATPFKILVASGHSSADMAFGQVFIEYGAHAPVQLSVYKAKALGYILMNARLAGFEMACACAHSGARSDYVFRFLHRPACNVIPGCIIRHIIPPLSTAFCRYRIICRILPLYDGGNVFHCHKKRSARKICAHSANLFDMRPGRNKSVGITVEVGSVLPKTFKVIKVPHFVVEDVDDYIAVVKYVPTALSAAVLAGG